MMKNLFSILIAIFVLILPFSALAQETEDHKTKAAISAAEEFLALVDSGHYQESWEEAASLFKSQIDKEKWVTEISRLRPLFGSAVNRTVINSKYMTSAPGAPDGEYVLIVFQSSFENKKKAFETVTPTLDHDGKWRVSGYFIK